MAEAPNQPYLICTIATGPNPIKTARIERCSDCSRDVWVTFASLAHAGDSAKPICISCALPRLRNSSDPFVQGVSEGQLRELKDAFGLEKKDLGLEGGKCAG